MGRSELVQCGKCGLNFLHEEGLGKHMKRVHEPKEQLRPSRYKCDRCSDEFGEKEDFKKHKLPEELNCELCERTGEKTVLPTKCELNFHIITHRTGKPKICDNCGGEFKNNKSLKNHKEQDKTVSCRRCNMVFTGTCPLQKHIKYEHDTTKELIPDLKPVSISLNENFVKKVKAEFSAPPAAKKLKAVSLDELKAVSLEEHLEDTSPQENLQQPEPQPGWAACEIVLGL